MKFRAVIFDLFGTLVGEPTPSYHIVAGKMAAILGIGIEAMNEAWGKTSLQRTVGGFRTIEDNISFVCRKLGVEASPEKIREAERVRYDFVFETLDAPRPGVLDVLSALRNRGLKTGLISNCSADTPLAWEASPFPPFFDVAVFSSSVGMKKPDLEIYLLAADRLAVGPGDCLYIGDGGSRELPGALRAGMHPVKIARAYLEESGRRRKFADEWDGPVIFSPEEILDLVE